MKAGVALVDVEALVVAECHGDVLGIDRASEKLDTVVRVTENLDIFDDRSRTDTTKGKTVDLFVSRKLESPETNRNVAENTTIVRIIR